VPLGPPRWRGGASGQPPRWQGAPNGQTPRGQGGANAQAPRRPDGGKFGRGRPANSGGPGAQSAPAGGRWSPGRAANGGAAAYSQPPRWGRGGRPSRPIPRDDQDTRRPQAPNVPAGGEIDPFELFCAYHLGITASGGYHIQNIHEVARRFGTNAAALRQTLTAYGMDAEDLVHSGFDLASAQIDIMVAPEGVSRRELARPLYDEFKNAPRKVRDWAKEMEEADREIQRSIGTDRWSPGRGDGRTR